MNDESATSPTGIIGRLAIATGFLTRLPVPGALFPAPPLPLAQAADAFALAGVIAALIPAFVLLAASMLGMPDLVSAVLAIAALAIVTGGLHEDGLADCGDGLAGYHEREKRLEIMRDSRIGAHGAVTLVLVLLLRVAALSAILAHAGGLGSAAILLGVAAASRAGMALFWFATPSARHEGLSASAGMPQKTAALRAQLIGLAILIVTALPFAPAGSLLIGLSFAALALYALRRVCLRQIGGQTGDVLGAAQLLAECALLCGLAIGG